MSQDDKLLAVIAAAGLYVVLRVWMFRLRWRRAQWLLNRSRGDRTLDQSPADRP